MHRKGITRDESRPVVAWSWELEQRLTANGHRIFGVIKYSKMESLS